MTQKHNTNRTALITGASGGLGLDFARLAAADGYNLLLVARSGDKLNLIAEEISRDYGVNVQVCVADLSLPTEVEKVIDFVNSTGISIDCLVNNAGFGDTGYFADRPWAVQQEMIYLNILALTRLSHAFVPGMKQRGHGFVLNIASTAAFQPGPNFTVYSATKAYVLSFTEALRQELKGSGVSCTCSCPGVTATGFHDRAATVGMRITRMGMMKSETVALQAWMAMKKGKQTIIHGFMNRLMNFSLRLTPRSAVPPMVASFMR
jgi:hypothetical protein